MDELVEDCQKSSERTDSNANLGGDGDRFLRTPLRLKHGLSVGNLLNGGQVSFETDPWNNEDDDYEDCLQQDYEDNVPRSEEFNSIIAPYEGKLRGQTQQWWSQSQEKKGVEAEVVEEEEKDLSGDGGVLKTILKPGTGSTIPENCKVIFNVYGIADGEKEPFDMTLFQGKNEVVNLGDPELVLMKGVRLALTSMKRNEVSKFVISPSYGLGSKACPPRIPAGKNLHYFFQIVDFITVEQMTKLEYMSARERNSKPFSEIVETAKRYKESGNFQYNEGNYSLAIRHYSKAVQFLEEYSVTTGEDEKVRSDALFALHLNMAQCHLKNKRPASACVQCKMALRQIDGQPDVMQSKLYFRFGRAKLDLGAYDVALQMAKKAENLNQKNLSARELVKDILARKKEDDIVLRDYYKVKLGGMFQESAASPVEKPIPESEDYWD